MDDYWSIVSVKSQEDVYAVEYLLYLSKNDELCQKREQIDIKLNHP